MAGDVTRAVMPLPLVGNVIELEARGLKEAQDRIKGVIAMANEMGARIRGVALLPKTRKTESGEPTPPKTTNATIVEELIASGRDFFTLRSAEANAVAGVVDAAFQRRIASHKAKMTPQQARGAAVGALIEAMKKYMEIVTKRINRQETATGSPASLSEGYAAHKQRKYGFADPIGVATGNLLENLDPSAAAANIRAIGAGGKG